MLSKKEIDEFLSNIIYKSSDIGYIEKYLRCKHCYFIPCINIHPIDGKLKLDLNCNCGTSIISFIDFFKSMINSLCSELICEKCKQKNYLSSNLFYYHVSFDRILCDNCCRILNKNCKTFERNNISKTNYIYYDDYDYDYDEDNYLDSYKYNSKIMKYKEPNERNILVNKSDYK